MANSDNDHSLWPHAVADHIWPHRNEKPGLAVDPADIGKAREAIGSFHKSAPHLFRRLGRIKCDLLLDQIKIALRPNSPANRAQNRH